MLLYNVSVTNNYWKNTHIRPPLPYMSFKFLFLVFRPPVITGETTLSEGDTLDLDCDVSTSSPLPSVQWFSPQGNLISNSSDLQIMDIQRDKAGMYTCIATHLYSGATLNSTVNVTVLCQCMYYTSDYASNLIFVYTFSYRFSKNMFL